MELQCSRLPKSVKNLPRNDKQTITTSLRVKWNETMVELKSNRLPQSVKNLPRNEKQTITTSLRTKCNEVWQSQHNGTKM